MRMAMPMPMMAMIFLPLTACAGTNGEGPDSASPQAMAQGPCSHDGLDRFTGQKATADLGAELLKASCAKTLRWGGPNMAMTMDFRPDRLTVSYDDQMVVTSARCG